MPKSKKKKKQHQSRPSQLRQERLSGKVDVVIPVFNQLALLTKCIESMRETASGLLGDFIFVDDASTEQGIGRLCTLHGRYMQNRQNLGFAGTCNRGALAVRTAWFVLANSDLIAIPGWIDSLMERMNMNEKYAIVGPLLLFSPDSIDPTRPAGRVQSCGFAININGEPYHRLIGWPPEHPKVQEPRDDIQGITAACWLVRTDVWRRLGGFDQQYGSYFEDIDLCVRARAAGYKIAYEPKARLYHKVGASWQGQDNQLPLKAQMFIQKNRGRFFYDEYLLL